ncbi:kinase-like protein [Dipodascopsis tothii]|uniref:kinase-like protein n=1 Tax=Dipodascopsis tothii TaxID=44089 RepID=UPI0034CF1A97
MSIDGGRRLIDRSYFKILENTNGEHTTNAHLGISSTAITQGYFDRFFVTERELGRGSRGSVSLVEHVLDGVSLGSFACKIVPVGDDHRWLERVLAEVKVLRLSHPNLVSYNHVWLEEWQMSAFGPSVPCAFILQEFCNGGTLEEFVSERKWRSLEGSENSTRSVERIKRWDPASQSDAFLPENVVVSFLKDISLGLNFLHENGFVHRDLKPSNCLLHLTGKNMPKVLVSDFGEGRSIGCERDATGTTGTLGYAAPETLIPNTHTGLYTNFSFHTDMFSLGMVLYYMCYSTLPYHHDIDTDFEKLHTEVIHWSGYQHRHSRRNISAEIERFLVRLLSVEPVKRGTTSELLESLSDPGPRSPISLNPDGPLSSQGFWEAPNFQVGDHSDNISWPIIGLGLFMLKVRSL